jgi:cytochrome c oxidase subunit 1
MHFYGLAGAPRRYYNLSQYSFLEGVRWMPLVITLFAFTMMAGQILFLVNLVKTLWSGEKAGENPWEATTLEWLAASPPPHGNWGEKDPVVYRRAYDYGNPESKQDYAPQWSPGA